MNVSTTRRGFLAIVSALALGAGGCSQSGNGDDGNETADAPESESEPIKAEIGDEIEAKTDYGDLLITVEGFVEEPEMQAKFENDGTMTEGLKLCMLLLIVKNVSYESSYVDINDAMYLEDVGGITLNTMTHVYQNYGKYLGVAGGYFECKQGQTMRVALPYQVAEDTASARLVIGDTYVDLPVTEKQ